MNILFVFRFLLLLCIIDLLSITAIAQPSVSDEDWLMVDSALLIEEVVVSATRTQRNLSQLPLAVQMLDRQEIEKSNAIRLSDLLEEQAGIMMVPDFGGGEGVQMQGMDSEHILILVDGLPLVGRSAGTLDLNRVTLGNVERIEIVKGASSGLYGNEALGGVINIITKRPEEHWDASLAYRYGSLDMHDITAGIGKRFGRFSWQSNYNFNRSGGYDLNPETPQKTVDPFHNQTISTKLQYQLNEKAKLTSNLRYFGQHQDILLANNQTQNAQIDEWNAALIYEHRWNAHWRWELENYYTRYNATQYSVDETFNSNFDQRLWRSEMRIAYKHAEYNELIVGLGYNSESLNRSFLLGQPQFDVPYVYAQYDLYLGNKLNFILGGRWDSHSDFRSQFSPKLAMRYEITDEWSVKGSVGAGFKAPDFRQLFFNFTNSASGYTVLGYNAVPTQMEALQNSGEIRQIVVPIDDFEGGLNPEASVSYNVGIDYAPSRALRLHANFFRNDISQLIDTRVIANKTNGQNVFSYYNIDEVRTQGVETTAEINYHTFNISAGYQYLDAIDQSAVEAFEAGEVFARLSPNSPSFRLESNDYRGLYNRSRHTGHLQLSYNAGENWSVDLRGVYRSSFALWDTNGNQYFDTYDQAAAGFFMGDVGVNYQFTNGVHIRAGIDNVLNYVDPPNLSNMPGRLLFVQIKYQL